MSLGEKSVPTTRTVVATWAVEWLNEIEGVPLAVPTVRVEEAESSSGVPVAVTVYELAATFATVKEPVNVPSEMEQVSEITGVPVSEQE
jgi:hypothetical protein